MPAKKAVVRGKRKGKQMVSENTPRETSCLTRKFMLNPKEFTNTFLCNTNNLKPTGRRTTKRWARNACTWIVRVPGDNRSPNGDYSGALPLKSEGVSYQKQSPDQKRETLTWCPPDVFFTFLNTDPKNYRSDAVSF